MVWPSFHELVVRSVPVVEGSLASEVVVVGNVAWNERDQVLLQSRTTGFVEKLHVRATYDAFKIDFGQDQIAHIDARDALGAVEKAPAQQFGHGHGAER